MEDVKINTQEVDVNTIYCENIKYWESLDLGDIFDFRYFPNYIILVSASGTTGKRSVVFYVPSNSGTYFIVKAVFTKQHKVASIPIKYVKYLLERLPIVLNFINATEGQKLCINCQRKYVHSNFSSLWISLTPSYYFMFEDLNKLDLLTSTVYYRIYNFTGDYKSYKDVFHCSFKYAKIKSKYGSGLWGYIDKLRDAGYSPLEAQHYFDACYRLNTTDRNILDYFNNLKSNAQLVYKDYLNMLRYLKNHQCNLKYPKTPKDNSYDHIDLLHDRILTIYNNLRFEERKQRNEELQKEYEQNYYEMFSKLNFENSDFIIFACKDLCDLIIEGKTLNHCVGTYIESVGTGKENILFLRRKDEPNTPFYTVDVYQNKVRQVHGKSNCSVTKPVSDFIALWAKKFGLDCSNYSGIYGRVL